MAKSTSRQSPRIDDAGAMFFATAADFRQRPAKNAAVSTMRDGVPWLGLRVGRFLLAALISVCTPVLADAQQELESALELSAGNDISPTAVRDATPAPCSV